jgi:hypothetical protein
MSSRKVKLIWDSPGFIVRLEQIAQPNLSAFARSIGISDQLIRTYMKGSIPGGDILVAMAREAKRSVEWLVTGNDRDDSFGCSWDEETRAACEDVAEILRSGNKAARAALLSNLEAFKEMVRQGDEIEKLKRFAKILEDRLNAREDPPADGDPEAASGTGFAGEKR